MFGMREQLSMHRQNGHKLIVSSRMAIQRIQTLREKKEALAKACLSTERQTLLVNYKLRLLEGTSRR